MARPKSARAHRQVLDAAVELFAARGIDATSMDAIAEASGVSKATIYKHWPDKDALALEVVAHLLGQDQPWPVFDTGDVRADMVALLSYEPPVTDAELRLRLMPHLMAYAARNPSFGEVWRRRVFEPPRAQLTQMLERAVAQDQLPHDLDRGLAIALLLGPMMYGHLLKRVREEAPEDLPRRVVAAFWKAHAVAKRQRPSQAE